MKNKLLGLGLIVTIISAFPTSTLADDNVAAGSQTITRNIINITPINLVNSAYQGRFADFDIPSHEGFLTAIRTNKIDSKVLVESAIEYGRLDPEKINDSAYLNQVQDLLKLKTHDD